MCRAKAAGCALIVFPEPSRRQFDVLAKFGLTKRAAKLVCDPLAYRSRRRVSIELDRLLSG
jgi:hypothetical protein